MGNKITFPPKFPLEKLPLRVGDSVVIPKGTVVYSNRSSVLRKKSLRKQTIVVDYLLPGGNSAGPYVAWTGGQNYLSWVDVNDLYDVRTYTETHSLLFSYIKTNGAAIPPVTDTGLVTTFFSLEEYVIHPKEHRLIQSGIDIEVSEGHTFTLAIHPKWQPFLLTNQMICEPGVYTIQLYIFNPTSRIISIPAGAPVFCGVVCDSKFVVCSEVEKF